MSTPLDAIPAEEVAKALGVTRQTALRMARRRELPSVKVGRTVTFRRSSIDAFLQRREKRA